MLKKTLLSTLFAVSTLATAQITLDLNMTITHQDMQRNIVSTVLVDEETTASVMFDGLDTLVVDFSTQTDGENVVINTQFFQKTDAEELIPATELFTVQVPFNEPATITVNDTDNDGSLVLVITPTLVE